MNQLCKKIKVSGRVQGVFFRAYTQKTAQDLHLSGWTRNENDGSVCVFACGSAQSLEKLIAALHQGPEAAQVTSVQVESVEYEAFTGFVIKR